MAQRPGLVGEYDSKDSLAPALSGFLYPGLCECCVLLLWGLFPMLNGKMACCCFTLGTNLCGVVPPDGQKGALHGCVPPCFKKVQSTVVGLPVGSSQESPSSTTLYLQKRLP